MERDNIFEHFEQGSRSWQQPGDTAISDYEEESEDDACSESEEDVNLDNDEDLSSEEDREEAQEEESLLTMLQPMIMSSLSSLINDTCDMASSVDETLASGNFEYDVTGVYEAKDGTRWSCNPPKTGLTPSSNIFRPRKAVTNPRGLITVGTAFKRFLNAKMIDAIVKFTNEEGERVRGIGWTKTDNVEIEAFVGCLIHMGALHVNMSPSTIVWNKTDGNHLVQACFSRQRFLQLSNHLRFDDKETRPARRACDNFAPLRDMWDELNLNLARNYTPGPTLTVDELLMSWRGRCSFLQYLPSKPDKYGIKIFWICDAENGFPLRGEPYLGRNGRDRQENLGRNIAISLTTPYFGSGRNLTVDSFFTDMVLSSHLLANNITLLGTVRKNKRFLPPEFQTCKGLAKGDAIFGFQKKSTLVAFKSNKSKHVILLSTMHHDDAFDMEERKPEIVTSYNATKGGVDVMDQMCHSLTTKRKTNRWSMLLFYNIVDIASIASLIIWRKANPEDRLSAEANRVQFNIAVARELVKPHLEMQQTKQTLPLYLRAIIRTAIEEYDQPGTGTQPKRPPDAPVSRKRARCHTCPRKNDRKTTLRCSSCNNFVCADHSKKRVMCRHCWTEHTRCIMMTEQLCLLPSCPPFTSPSFLPPMPTAVLSPARSEVPFEVEGGKLIQVGMTGP